MKKELKETVKIIKRNTGTLYSGEFILLHLTENNDSLNEIRKKRYEILLPLYLKLEDDLVKVMNNFKRWPKFERQGLVDFVRKDLSTTLRATRNLAVDTSNLFTTQHKAMTNLEQYIDNIRLANRLKYISDGFHKELTETPAKLHKELTYVLKLLHREKGILENMIFKNKKECDSTGA